MQKLKNKTTGEEFVITGSIGVPREVEENVFEVWTHFSIDLDGDGQIDTVEVHPESTEWEVIDVADIVQEPEPTPEPEQLPEPEPYVFSPEELAVQKAAQDKQEFLQKLATWDAQRVAGLFVTSRGGTIDHADGQAFMELEQWLLTNWKVEYALEAKPYLSNLGI